MKLRKLRCTNCDGPLTIANGKYFCDSCGTSYPLEDDNDEDNDAFKRSEVKQPTPRIEKTVPSGQPYRRSSTKRPVFSVFWAILCIAIAILNAYRSGLSKKNEEARESLRNMNYSQQLTQFSMDIESLTIETYSTEPVETIAPSDVLADQEFCDQLLSRSDFVIRDQIFTPVGYEEAGEPQYVGSYLLTSTTSYYKPKIVVIYSLTWSNEDGERQMYDAVVFDNVEIAEDGSFDFGTSGLDGHFTTIDAVIFQGYDDLDVLLAEQVSGRNFYEASELALA